MPLDSSCMSQSTPISTGACSSLTEHPPCCASQPSRSSPSSSRDTALGHGLIEEHRQRTFSPPLCRRGESPPSYDIPGRIRRPAFGGTSRRRTLNCAEGETRTLTWGKPNWILSPARLPVPPLRRFHCRFRIGDCGMLAIRNRQLPVCNPLVHPPGLEPGTH